MSKKLIIFDRDGTLNFDENGYTHNKACCILYEDVYKFFSAIDIFINICVVTNQSGIGRGFYSEKAMHEFNLEINNLIRKKTSHRGIDHFFFCPHTPSDNCDCRKPENALVREALRFFKCQPDEALLVGDKLSDCKAGLKTSVQSILLDRNNLFCDEKHLPNDIEVFESLDIHNFKKYL